MITLGDIRKKQAEHKAALTAYREKVAEVIDKKAAYHQAEMELENLSIAARNGTNELRSIGAEFALQIDDDFTPKLTGTELPGERIWMPEDSHHPQAFAPDGYDGYYDGYGSVNQWPEMAPNEVPKAAHPKWGLLKHD